MHFRLTCSFYPPLKLGRTTLVHAAQAHFVLSRLGTSLLILTYYPAHLPRNKQLHSSRKRGSKSGKNLDLFCSPLTLSISSIQLKPRLNVQLQTTQPDIMATTAEAERHDLDETSPDLKTVATATATATTTERHAPTTEESDLQAESEGDFRDDDSAIGDDAASSTASINSSIMQYRTENGRTYHSFRESINYVLPNDSSEQERLDLQHHLFTLTLGGKLYLSPLQKGNKPIERTLDAGTGTGVWAIDYADNHPETQVLGIDLSPIQPNFLPTNLEFQVDDLEDEWTYSYKFDFVFARMLTGSIGDWPKFFKQSFDSLNPGGWVECQDITFPAASDDGTLVKGSYIDQWSEFMTEAASNFGRSAVSAKSYKQQMIDAGFVNVTEVVYKWPTNRWPADPYYKELGFWCNHNIAGELSGLSLALFTKGLGWSVEEVEVFLAKVRTDMRDRRIHAWWPIHVVYGQKPEF